MFIFHPSFPWQGNIQLILSFSSPRCSFTKSIKFFNARSQKLAKLIILSYVFIVWRLKFWQVQEFFYDICMQMSLQYQISKQAGWGGYWYIVKYRTSISCSFSLSRGTMQNLVCYNVFFPLFYLYRFLRSELFTFTML